MGWTEEEVEAIMKQASKVEELDAEILKRKLKYKVRLERMMKPKQIRRKSDYEKKRIQTMEKNLSLKYSIGLPMPDKKILQVQLGIRRRVFRENVKPADKDDFNWTPNHQKPKKTGPKPMTVAEIAKRKLWVEKNLSVDEEGNPAKLEDLEALEKLRKI